MGHMFGDFMIHHTILYRPVTVPRTNVFLTEVLQVWIHIKFQKYKTEFEWNRSKKIHAG